jgi:CHAD domain-containing protein
MRLDPELLEGPPATGARVLALGRLADAEEAATRLGDPADLEALHDFRVAVRRLRSTLRPLAPALEGVLTGKQRRRLARLARRSNPTRDAEVLVAWLGEARARLAAPYRGALDWLLDRVERRRAEGARDVLEVALPRFRRLAPRLTRRLSARPPAGAAAPATLAALLASALRAQARLLREALGAVVGGEDAAGLHRARIEGKRLRYLLEPLRGLPGADATEAVDALKGLQELLGRWHDLHQARQALAGALLEAAADRARRDRGAPSGDLRPGLLAIDQLAAREADEIYGRLAEGYLRGRATGVLDLAYAVVAGLEGPQDEEAAGAAPVASERRLLLTGLPPEAGGGEAVETELGWLPGETERVGLARSASGEGWFRERSAPHGAIQIDSISRADFEAWWPLTEGRRLARRVHRSGALPGWRFEEFTDRRLVLAVVEAGADATAPAWLEPAVVREVTGERAYRDEALARRAPRRG